jgi:segregation and condensation protein B
MSRPDDLVRGVEAALFAAEEPMTAETLSAHLGGADVREALRELEEHYREREQVRKLSRAATEVLAIVAYHEPVSRAEIEAIRGVQTSPGTLDVLMEAGWVRVAGRREVPGRPVIYATTPEFLSHFGLESRRDLPGIEELKAAGLLDPVDMAIEALGASEEQSEAAALENPEESA